MGITHLGVAVEGFYDVDLLAQFETATGTHADVALLSFDDVSVAWNGDRIAPFVARGTAPQLTWGTSSLADIAAGVWDDQIDETARMSLGTGVQVRPFHEMNGTFSPYHVDPAVYIAAWQRARQVWRAAGNNAPWIWSPNITGGQTAQAFAPYYPGDDQCEMVGLDGYSYPQAGNLSFEATFHADLVTLGNLSTRPLAICETGVDQDTPNRATWITAMFAYLRAHPRIEHLTYWNREQYRIDNDPDAAQAFRVGASGWRR